MERAIQTGSIIARHLDVPLIALPDCHEVGGIYLERIVGDKPVISMEYGLNASYIQATYPFYALSIISMKRVGGRVARKTANSLPKEPRG